MSYIALFCTCVAIATLQNGGAHEGHLLETSGVQQSQRSASWVKLGGGRDHEVKFQEARDLLTPRLRRDHKITKRHVYSSQRYGAAPPMPKPTPSPVQEKFFKEQIKSLPVAARERLKQIYAGTGFTQEFQELLLRELVRTHDKSADQGGSGKQSGAFNNGGPNLNDVQIRGRTVSEGQISPGQANRVSTADRSFTASGRTPGRNNQYVDPQGDVRMEGRVGPNEIVGNTAFASNTPQAASNNHVSPPHYADSTALNDNALPRQVRTENYGIDRVNARAPAGQQNIRPFASSELSQQNVGHRQMTQQVPSRGQINTKQSDPNYQQHHQIALNQQRYLTYNKQQTHHNQIQRIPIQQNILQNQQETMSNQNQVISSPQRHRQINNQNYQNGQQNVVQSQQNYQPQYIQNQQRFVQKHQSYPNHQNDQPGPTLHQANTNFHNQPQQVQTKYQLPQIASNHRNGYFTHKAPTTYPANRNEDNRNARDDQYLTHPLRKQAQPTNSRNTAQTISGNVESQRNVQQYEYFQNVDTRQMNNVNIDSQSNVNSENHIASQNVNRNNSFSQQANHLYTASQSGHNLHTEIQPVNKFHPGNKLHSGQQPVNNLHTGQQPVNNLHTGQQPVNNLHPKQQPVNNLHPGEQPVNNLHTGQQPVNNVHLGQQPVNNLHPGQQPLNNLHPRQQPVNNLPPGQQTVNNLHTGQQPVNNLHTGQQPVNNLHPKQQPVNNLHPGEQPVNNLHTGQQPVNNVHLGQQPVNNLHPGQQPLNNLHPRQQPVNNLPPGQQTVNNLHTGQQLVNNLHTGQQPVNNLHTGQQPVNNLHSGQHPVNNVQPTSQPAIIVNTNVTSTVPTQTWVQSTPVPTTVQQPPGTVQATSSTPMPPSPVIDFLNTKIIIPPHINGNPAMRAAFIKVITGAMSRKRQESPTTATPWRSSTSRMVTTSTQMPAPIANVVLNTTTTTTASTTTVTTTAAPLYNKSVELAPALYLTWSLPQPQIDSLRGSTLSAILNSINASRSEQLPGNTFVEGFKTFLIDTLLADPMSYVPSLDDVLPRTYYDRLDHGAMILIKDILGGFVRLEHPDLAKRVKRSLTEETNSGGWKKHNQSLTKAFKISKICSDDFCSTSSTKVTSRKLGILGIVQDQLRQYKEQKFTNKNSLPSFQSSLKFKIMKPTLGEIPTVGNIKQILKVPKQQGIVNFFMYNDESICALFETLSQRNKCVINLRNHHIRRSHLQCRKILTVDEKSKCKRNVVQRVLRRSCAARKNDKGHASHAAPRVQKEVTRLRGCGRQRHSLKKRAAAGPGVKSLPVLRFTWLLPKDSFPSAPLETMQYIMDKYKRKVTITERTTVVPGREVLNGNPNVQLGAGINDPMAYLNKLIEAANALSKLQGMSVDVLAGALHIPVSQSHPINMIMKSHARVGQPWNTHSNAHVSTPSTSTPVPFTQSLPLTTPTTEFRTTTQTMLDNKKPFDHLAVSTSMNSSFQSFQGQGVPPILPLPIGDVESLVQIMSSKFKNVSPLMLRSIITNIAQEFHSEAPPTTTNQSAVNLNTVIAHAPLTNATQDNKMTLESTHQSLSPVQMTTAITHQTPIHSSMPMPEIVTLPSVTKIMVAPQAPAPTTSPILTESTPGPIKNLPEAYQQQTLSEISTPPFRVSMSPFSTMSVLANKYMMNVHFKGLPQLDLTTLPSIQANAQSTTDSFKALPTSASPVEVAEFMRYLISTLRYSGHIFPEANPSHGNMPRSHVDAVTPSSGVTLTYSDKTNNSQSHNYLAVSNPNERLTPQNQLTVLDINSKSHINKPITLKSNPSMEALLLMSHLSDNNSIFRPIQPSLADTVTVNPMSGIDSGFLDTPTAMVSSSSLNNNLNSNVVNYVSSALSNMLMSQPAIVNARESDIHANQAKQSSSAVFEGGGTGSSSQSDLSILSPGVLLRSENLNTHSHNNHYTDLHPSKISTNAHTNPILKPPPQPRDVKALDVSLHRETYHQAGNYIQETASTSHYAAQDHAATSICPLGLTMECMPTRPSARLVAFCRERCDQLTGICSSALCVCECLGSDAQPQVSKVVDTPAAPAASYNSAPKLDTLHSDGFQISMINPDLLTTTTTPAPSVTPTDDRLRKFLNLLDKVKGKKLEATTEETEPADK